MNAVAIKRYWDAFLATQPVTSEYHQKTYIAEGFGDNADLADQLGKLVLNGIKSGTCSAVWEYEADESPFPQQGQIWIVLDGQGEPICITETVEVKFRRFDEVDEEFAKCEGEGDLSLQHWREMHKNFFSRILPKFGREFSEDMPLVCERFKVIHK